MFFNSKKRFVAAFALTAILSTSFSYGAEAKYSHQGAGSNAYIAAEAGAYTSTTGTKVSNDRPYYWYMDQANTGTYRDGNCGPTSAAMVMKWLNRYSAITGESAREEYPMDGGWWSTNTLEEFFTKYRVNYQNLYYSRPDVIKNAIDRGSIVVVCMEMGYIPRNYRPDSSNKDRFYDFAGGHFLIIKGYTIENDRLYFEVYDPNNWGMTYSSNGQEMGKDRLYYSYDVDRAIKNWWQTVYEIKAR